MAPIGSMPRISASQALVKTRSGDHQPAGQEAEVRVDRATDPLERSAAVGSYHVRADPPGADMKALRHLWRCLSCWCDPLGVWIR
jgi:hypothetical protein